MITTFLISSACPSNYRAADLLEHGRQGTLATAANMFGSVTSHPIYKKVSLEKYNQKNESPSPNWNGLKRHISFLGKTLQPQFETMAEEAVETSIIRNFHPIYPCRSL